MWYSAVLQTTPWLLSCNNSSTLIIEDQLFLIVVELLLNNIVTSKSQQTLDCVRDNRYRIPFCSASSLFLVRTVNLANLLFICSTLSQQYECVCACVVNRGCLIPSTPERTIPSLGQSNCRDCLLYVKIPRSPSICSSSPSFSLLTTRRIKIEHTNVNRSTITSLIKCK